MSCQVHVLIFVTLWLAIYGLLITNHHYFYLQVFLRSCTRNKYRGACGIDSYKIWYGPLALQSTYASSSCIFISSSFRMEMLKMSFQKKKKDIYEKDIYSFPFSSRRTAGEAPTYFFIIYVKKMCTVYQALGPKEGN